VKTLLFKKFFPIGDVCLRCEDIARQSCDGAQMANFSRFFGSFLSQRAACSTFQTCILNSHWGHTMSRSMVDIQSATAENRRGKEDRKIEINHREKYNGLPYSIG